MQTDQQRSDDVLMALGEAELDATLREDETVPEGHTAEDAARDRAIAAHQEIARLTAARDAATRARQDAVIELRDVHGWSHQLVADALGVKRATAQGIAERRTSSGTRRRAE